MATDWVVLHAGALGDLALTIQLALRLPAVDASSTLRVVSRTDCGDLAECRPAVTRRSTEGLGLHWVHADAGVAPARLRELVKGRRVLSALAAAGSRVERRLRALGPLALFSFDPRPEPGLDAHIIRYWERQLARQGLRLAPARGAPSLRVPADRRAGGPRGRAVLAELGLSRAPMLIHPGSGSRAKRWPLASFLDVAGRLRARGEQVCFVVGAVEEESWPRADLDALRGAFPLAVCRAPDELVGLLIAARALISGDCGPAHLAALLGTRTVTLFGPSAARCWGPLGEGAVAVAGDPGSGPEWGIRPARVVAAALCAP